MRDTRKLHPMLQTLVPQFLADCYRDNLFIKITETFRSVAEQDALYAQGRSTKGNIVTNAKGSDYSSMHQWGVAIDFCLLMDVNGNGRINDDAFNDSKGHFKKCAALAKPLGFEWGGDWKSIVDKPHLQLKQFSADGSTSHLKRTYGTFDKFKKTWGTSEVSVNWADLSASDLKKLINKRFNARIKLKCTLYKRANGIDGKFFSGLPKGTYIIHKKDMGNGWSKVQYADKSGYIKNSCVDGVKGLSKYNTTKLTKNVWLRSKRKIAVKTRIGKKPIIAGTTIKIVYIKREWAKIKTTSLGEGFVKKSVLK